MCTPIYYRSLGDVVFKTPRELVTPVPDVSRVPLLHGRDSFLLLASYVVGSNLSHVSCSGVERHLMPNVAKSF